MRIMTWLRSYFVALFLLLTACGGGGGGGSASTPIAYGGATSQATVTSANAQELAVGAYEGGLVGSALGVVGGVAESGPTAASGSLRPQALAAALKGAVQRVVGRGANSAPTVAGAVVQNMIPGAVSGSLSYTVTIDDTTGVFSGTISFNSYKDSQNTPVLNGNVSFSGTYSQASQSFVSFSINFSMVHSGSNGGGFTASGSMNWNQTGTSQTLHTTLVLRDDSSGTTYWVKDYVYTMSAQGGLTLTGTYYHPGYGYVTVTCPAPLQVTSFDALPTAGSLLISGANGSRAWLNFTAGGYSTVMSQNTPPVANAGSPQAVYVGASSLVTLDGSASSDADNDPLTFTWTFASKPAGSAAALSDATAVKPTFVPDIPGDYVLSLVVNDGGSDSPPATVTVSAYLPVSPLGFRPVDAEYSKSLDRIVMIAATPANQLHIYDPVAGTDTPVNLPLVAACVSVSPDGQFAAVGHNAWISYVNLATATLVKTIPVTADVGDIVLAGNGYVYVFPRVDQWVGIHSVEIATGIETVKSNWEIYAGTKAKLHPGGTAMYGATVGLSPSNIEKYDISGGPSTYLCGSPYWGDYAMGGDLWISEDGLRIFTRAGNVFRSSPVKTEDMTYAGALESNPIVRHLSHSAAIGKVAAIPDTSYLSSTPQDTEVQVFDYDYLTLSSRVPLPGFVVAGKKYAGHGRYVFYRSDGSKMFVVIQADPTSGLLYDYGVVRY